MSHRRTGRTTLQIEGAPFGAIFVVATAGMVGYVQDIMQKVGRTDLVVKLPSFLERLDGWRGHLVVDHHAMDTLSGAQFEGIRKYQQRIGGA